MSDVRYDDTTILLMPMIACAAALFYFAARRAPHYRHDTCALRVGVAVTLRYDIAYAIMMLII